MLSFLLPNPVKKAEKAYYAKLAEATQAQRNGKISEFAELTTEAEGLRKKLEELKASKK